MTMQTMQHNLGEAELFNLSGITKIATETTPTKSCHWGGPVKEPRDRCLQESTYMTMQAMQHTGGRIIQSDWNPKNCHCDDPHKKLPLGWPC